ncbi:MAG: peptidase S41 [Deltaproteobacteria bacterium CG23_combo_of_CG06-09_8_20_14_all_51_20]|nr:S41 family peptidase [bacterium]NCP07742.1 S41 family peptidase [bacterium]OIP39102.1 MAG: hypothetical protein AUK25_11185 [Desulfobacteraceae bacterium CG2_30_51_40]PIP46691.1 MAG: peptidase S41 [Deltaproteobacteria bacterium CG23_combo_of_CG06-09_8_20_14_all_51_20]PJB34215.1 MAG: peptidase S41 [Deltaproteobacteria bacterium CG_4_9_14_3_um_filter_51_14]
MNIHRKRFLLTAGLVGILFCGAVVFMWGRGQVKAAPDDVYKNMEVLAEVLRHIEKNYVEPREPKDLIYGAIKGMVQSLDAHSAFMTREEHQELMMETKGSFTGIGIEITIKDRVLTVVSPIEGTPAFEAGLKAADRIISIEDKTTKDMSLMEAVKLIRGPKGTKVNLTVVREGADKPLKFTMVRDVIPLISVRKHMLNPEMGYVRVSNFQSKTGSDLAESLEALENGRQLKGLILDLRNNPGGLLSQAIEVSELFLEEGVIVSTKARDSSQNIVAKAHPNKAPRNYPIVILVNGGTASAAEIVAGALQDNKKALVLGTRTFGKGSVQTILPLSDGAGLRLTTARYYTPSGRSIQLDGIVPDIDVDFVPPADKEEKGPKHTVREADLDRAMPKEKAQEVQPDKDKNQVLDLDARAKELVEKDNQVRYAMQLLQSWTIFSKIR